MCGFETTMNGRFRRACIRCASRIGRRLSVKFAEENRASKESGGRPCLTLGSRERLQQGVERDGDLPDQISQTQWVKRLCC